MPEGASVRMIDAERPDAEEGLPGQQSSTGPVALADVDGDGDLDLFVGGRVVPRRYPEAASSRLFRNEGAKFVLEARKGRALEKVGLVSGAVFSDLDGDGQPELILACEWGPLKILRNERGNLVPWDAPVTFNNQPSTLNHLSGLWNGVTTGDFDGDGRGYRRFELGNQHPIPIPCGPTDPTLLRGLRPERRDQRHRNVL
jgi:hypothetical protein